MYLSQPWKYRAALAALNRGGLIAYPTESVWGLGCDPFNPAAVEKLLALKQRRVEKGLILVASSVHQFGALLPRLDTAQRQKLSGTYNKPTTWLVPSHGLVPYWLTGEHSTIAIRISQHATVVALCQQFGGLIVSTSANPAGLAPALNQCKARSYFGAEVEAYVSGRTGGEAQPSQIIDLKTGRVLRG